VRPRARAPGRGSVPGPASEPADAQREPRAVGSRDRNLGPGPAVSRTPERSRGVGRRRYAATLHRRVGSREYASRSLFGAGPSWCGHDRLRRRTRAGHVPTTGAPTRTRLCRPLVNPGRNRGGRPPGAGCTQLYTRCLDRSEYSPWSLLTGRRRRPEATTASRLASVEGRRAARLAEVGRRPALGRVEGGRTTGGGRSKLRVPDSSLQRAPPRGRICRGTTVNGPVPVITPRRNGPAPLARRTPAVHVRAGPGPLGLAQQVRPGAGHAAFSFTVGGAGGSATQVARLYPSA
jgi:hypothetical protein